MKKTKQLILQTAKTLFTEHGVAKVSIRQIATEMGISHSNLIYHYKSKQALLTGLHQQLLEAALEINQDFHKADELVRALHDSTQVGFRVLYDYRFFMIDLNYIMREHPTLHQTFLQIEELRAKLYREVFTKGIATGYMRPPEYPNEYEQFIQRIRIFSDYWIPSAAIYDETDADTIITQYVHTFMNMFYPYLTAKGKAEYLLVNQ
ncbi:MAG: TetR/AcrR family transcriptional regulator [Bacteroidota bacterium]